MINPTKNYVISLSLDYYVQLTGVFLGNARDELILSGDEENKELINKAIEIIDNNLIVENKDEYYGEAIACPPKERRYNG